MENKKIKNATATIIDGIDFKSKIEASVYKHLVAAGFKPQYEKQTFVLWEGFKPTIPFYTKKKGDNTLYMNKLIDIKYTPDFTFEYNGLYVIIEVKGIQNDVFPYKFKMFRKLIENSELRTRTLLFEIFSIKQLKECIEIIKTHDCNNRQNAEFNPITDRKG